MWREAGKSARELWSAVIVILVVVGDILGTFDGTWFETALLIAFPLLLIWLACFAIGVSRVTTI